MTLEVLETIKNDDIHRYPQDKLGTIDLVESILSCFYMQAFSDMDTSCISVRWYASVLTIPDTSRLSRDFLQTVETDTDTSTARARIDFVSLRRADMLDDVVTGNNTWMTSRYDTDADVEQTKVLAWAYTCPASWTPRMTRSLKKSDNRLKIHGSSIHRSSVQYWKKKSANEASHQTLFRILWANGWDTDGGDRMC